MYSTSPGYSCSTSSNCSMGWHMLFAHTSWSAITTEQVESFSFQIISKSCKCLLVRYGQAQTLPFDWPSSGVGEICKIQISNCQFSWIKVITSMPPLSVTLWNLKLNRKLRCEVSMSHSEQLQRALLWQKKSSAHPMIQLKQCCARVSSVDHCACQQKAVKWASQEQKGTWFLNLL